MDNFCTVCGNKLTAEDNFCAHCGNRVKINVSNTIANLTSASQKNNDDDSFDETVTFLGLSIVALDKLNGNFGDVIDVAASVINDFDMLDIGNLADISDVSDLADLADACDLLDGIGFLGGFLG